MIKAEIELVNIEKQKNRIAAYALGVKELNEKMKERKSEAGEEN